MQTDTRQLTAGQLTSQSTCFVCGSYRLVPIHEGVFRLGLSLMDPEASPTLAPYEGKQFVLNCCKHCGFIQPEGLPSDPNYFNALYSQKWSEEWMIRDFDSTYKDRIFRGILKEIRARIKRPPKKLLDVGTHVGKMIHIACQENWEADGIELNPRTREIAMRKTGCSVHCLTAKELADTGVTFDAITITDVLEHIPDPVRILSDLRSMLNPGGVIAVKVPSGRNQLRKEKLRVLLGMVESAEIGTNLVHVNHFSPTALKQTLMRAGFVEPCVVVGAPELPPEGGISGFLSRLIRLSVYKVARLPGGVHTPFALNLQAFAMA